MGQGWDKGTGFLSRRKSTNKELNKCKKGGTPYTVPPVPSEPMKRKLLLQKKKREGFIGVNCLVNRKTGF